MLTVQLMHPELMLNFSRLVDISLLKRMKTLRSCPSGNNLTWDVGIAVSLPIG